MAAAPRVGYFLRFFRDRTPDRSATRVAASVSTAVHVCSRSWTSLVIIPMMSLIACNLRCVEDTSTVAANDGVQH